METEVAELCGAWLMHDAWCMSEAAPAPRIPCCDGGYHTTTVACVGIILVFVLYGVCVLYSNPCTYAHYISKAMAQVCTGCGA